MLIPNIETYNPDPSYLRALIERAGLSQNEAARTIGIGERVMRKYLRLPEPESQAPYPVQFALECLPEA